MIVAEDLSSISPGATALTLMRSRPTSLAIDLVMAMMAPFDAVQRAKNGTPLRTVAKAMSTIRPKRCSSSAGTLPRSSAIPRGR